MLDKNSKQRISDWARRQIYNDDCPDSLVLRHLGAANKIGNEVAKFKVSREFSPENFQDLLHEIETVATDDAEGLASGLQKYVLLPYSSEGKTAGRCVFAIAASSGDDSESDLDSEPPTSRGLVAMLMRHCEAMARVTSAGTGHIIQMQARTIQQLSEMNQHTQAKHLEYVEAIEGLKSQQHERDLQTAQAAFKQESIREVTNKALLLLPAIANKIIAPKGQKLLTEKTTTAEQMVMSLMSTIKPEQFEKLQTALTPEQTMTLVQLYEYMQRRDKEISEKKEEEK